MSVASDRVIINIWTLSWDCVRYVWNIIGRATICATACQKALKTSRKVRKTTNTTADVCKYVSTHRVVNPGSINVECSTDRTNRFFEMFCWCKWALHAPTILCVPPPAGNPGAALAWRNEREGVEHFHWLTSFQPVTVRGEPQSNSLIACDMWITHVAVLFPNEFRCVWRWTTVQY